MHAMRAQPSGTFPRPGMRTDGQPQQASRYQLSACFIAMMLDSANRSRWLQPRARSPRDGRPRGVGQSNASVLSRK